MYQNSPQQPTEKYRRLPVKKGCVTYMYMYIHVFIRLKLLVFLKFIFFMSYIHVHNNFLWFSLPLFDFPLAQVGLNYENQEPDCSHLNRGQWWVLPLLLRSCVIQLFQILKYKVNECIWFWFNKFLYCMCINLNANCSFMIYKAYRKTKINF